MCGIVGYVGSLEAVDFLLAGLRRLEYRGYDSSGIAMTAKDGPCCEVVKSVGRIDQLQACLQRTPLKGGTGVGHTRWATHGVANEVNAHPHVGGDGAVAVVHNGVIENFQVLKERLECEGYKFLSATDTEVIAHLIDSCLKQQPPVADMAAADYDPLVRAVQSALAQLHGTYGLAVLFRDYPEVLVAARLGSPLIVGVGDGEHFVASDASPLAGRTQRIVYLADHELAVLTADSLRVVHRDHGRVSHNVQVLEMDADDVGMDGYEHFMLKEIFEQPESLKNAMRGRLDLDAASTKFGGLNLTPQQLRGVSRLMMTACGRVGMRHSWASTRSSRSHVCRWKWSTPANCGTETRPWIRIPCCLPSRKAARRPTRWRSAGNETQRLSERFPFATWWGARSPRRPMAAFISTRALKWESPPPRRSLRSASSWQCWRSISAACATSASMPGVRMMDELQELPDKVEKALATNSEVKRIALKYANANNFLYLGRQFNFPAALEGALKLKEISYIHAEGYPAAEMKHGPIALVDRHTPSVFLMPQGPVYDKVMANVQEIKARGGPVIAVVGEGDSLVKRLADDIIEIPAVADYLQPIVSVIPLQLLAYHIAVARGCDVDKPRNLAKSVTVE